jgi:hypothetical protein
VFVHNERFKFKNKVLFMNNQKQTSSGGRQPKLLDQVRYVIRAKHYSIRTEESYIQWIKRFILFHNKRHPEEMGEKEISQYLTYLAVQGVG